MSTPPGPSDELIYHYTDENALLSILDPKKLVIWASEALYLNDSQEVIYGRRRLIEILKAAAVELREHAGPDTGINLDLFRASIIEAGAMSAESFGNNEERPSLRAFIACFCRDWDLLSQWRSYGKGGYAIGFKPDLLANAGVEYPPPDPDSDAYSLVTAPVRLERVRYEDEVTSQLDSAEIVDAIALPGYNPGQRHVPQMEATWNAIYELCKIKHSAFREEKEERLIYVRRVPAPPGAVRVPVPPVKFRSGPLTIVPYVELKFSKEAVAEIIVGPSAQQDLRVRAVRRVLEQYEYEGVEVRTSKAPYRA